MVSRPSPWATFDCPSSTEAALQSPLSPELLLAGCALLRGLSLFDFRIGYFLRAVCSVHVAARSCSLRRALLSALSGERVGWGLLFQLFKIRNQKKPPPLYFPVCFSGTWCWMPGRRWQIRPPPISLLTRVSFPSRAPPPLHPLSFTAFSWKMRRAPKMIPVLALVAFMTGCANAALTCASGDHGILRDRSKCWAPDINRLAGGGSLQCDSDGWVSEASMCVRSARRLLQGGGGASIHCNYRAREPLQTAG